MKESDEKELVMRCRAGCLHFVEFSYWDEDKEMYIVITAGGQSLWQRLKAAFQALKGARYGACEEILLYKKDINKLKKWLDDLK